LSLPICSILRIIILQCKVAIFSLFWMQLDCILLAHLPWYGLSRTVPGVQLLANEKLPDFAL